MENYEREYFLSKIIAGYNIFIKSGEKLKIKYPSLEIIYESNEIFKEIYEQSLEDGFLTEEQALEILLETEDWDSEKEENYSKKINEDIEKFQEGLYVYAYKPKECERIRKYLERAREELYDLFIIRTKYDQYTCKGLASYAKNNHLVENSVFNYDNTVYKWEKFSILDIVDYNNKNQISVDIIRELSRTTPWANQWGSCKINGSIFPCSGVELTTSQNLLLMWSRMYDSIYESTESPEQFIIDDDDTLDGWLIVQKRKNKERKAKNAVESFTENNKIRNAQEIFLVAKDLEDAKRIHEMNSQKSNIIKKQRIKKILNKGEVKHQEFSDVQQERTIEMTKAYQSHMKGKG